MRGKSIHDVLELTVTEAIEFFRPGKEYEALVEPLELLKQVGLGYLRLGQPVNVLSGGESQRLKLVGHLAESKKNRRHALLIFDEPTTGLHFDDIAALLKSVSATSGARRHLDRNRTQSGCHPVRGLCHRSRPGSRR